MGAFRGGASVYLLDIVNGIAYNGVEGTKGNESHAGEGRGLDLEGRLLIERMTIAVMTWSKNTDFFVSRSPACVV